MCLVAGRPFGPEIVSQRLLRPVDLHINIVQRIKLQHVAQHSGEFRTFFGSDFAIGIEETRRFGAVDRRIQGVVAATDPSVEDTVRGAIRQTSGGSYLALDPTVSRKLLEKIKATVGDIGMMSARPVMLTSMDIRRYMRKMIEQDLYELAVVSYQELTSEINIQPLAKIEI